MAKKIGLDIHRDEFKKLYDEGYSIRQIAKIYGVNKNSVAIQLKKITKIKERGIDEETLEDIYKMYEAGYCVNQIAKKYNYSFSTTKRALSRKYGKVTDGDRLYEDLIDDFIIDYNNNLSLTEISEKYNVPRETIHQYLFESLVKLRNYSETSRLYNLDESYFNELTHKKAYELGVLFSFVNLVSSLNTKIIRLTRANSESNKIIELAKLFTDKDDLILDEKTNTVSLAIHSSIMYDDMVKYGYGSDRINIPDEFIYDFFSGYFRECLFINNRKLTIGTKTKLRKSVDNFLKEKVGIEIRYDNSTIVVEKNEYLFKLVNKFPEIIELIENYLKSNDSTKWKNFIKKYKKSL